MSFASYLKALTIGLFKSFGHLPCSVPPGIFKTVEILLDLKDFNKSETHRIFRTVNRDLSTSGEMK